MVIRANLYHAGQPLQGPPHVLRSEGAEKAGDPPLGPSETGGGWLIIELRNRYPGKKVSPANHPAAPFHQAWELGLGHHSAERRS